MKKLFMLFVMGIFLFSFISSVSSLSISVDIPEKYMEVHAGEKFYFEVEVKYPENNIRKDLIFEFDVKKGDEIISHSKTLKAIETQMSFLDSINIPEDTDNGLYTLQVSVSDYDDLYEEVSTTFQVVEKKDSHFSLWIAIGVLFILMLIILIWKFI